MSVDQWSRKDDPHLSIRIPLPGRDCSTVAQSNAQGVSTLGRESAKICAAFVRMAGLQRTHLGRLIPALAA